MKQKSKYDIIIVGGGHAGVEAANISAKMNCSVLMITMDKKAIGRMSCNPASGGLAKGQMVREIDMLGGLMGRLADKSGIQFKILNKSKGRAVWSPRAQIDKRHYESLVAPAIINNKTLMFSWVKWLNCWWTITRFPGFRCEITHLFLENRLF